MDKNSEKRLKELKNIVNDVRLEKLLIEIVKLENDLEKLNQVEKIRVNADCVKNPVKVTPAFYAYHKTLSAYKEAIKLLIAKTEASEESPLREYLNSIKARDDEYTD